MKTYKLIGALEVWSHVSERDKKNDEIFLQLSFANESDAKNHIEKLIFEKVREYESNGFQCRIV